MAKNTSVVDLITMSPEKLQEKVIAGVIETVSDRLFDAEELDIASMVKAAVLEETSDAIKAKISRELSQAIKDGIENLTFPVTNSYGEKKAPDLTIREYCLKEAAAWLAEKVDGMGRSGRDGYGATQTRITSIIHQYLHYSLETIVKDAIKNANAILVGGIEETVKIKLGEIRDSLKVSVAVKQ